VLPAVSLLTYLQWSFYKSVLRSQIAITFFEAIVWMCPIVILENLYMLGAIVATGLPRDGGICGKCILSSFIQVGIGRQEAKPAAAESGGG
jgi:hypothetical protein